MSADQIPVSTLKFEVPWLTLRDLTFLPLRLNCARLLVIFSFVWPFFNYDLIVPGNTTEINFLPVLLAAALVPEILFRDPWSVLLSLPVFAVALLGAPVSAAMRLAIGIVPLLFILNLTQRLREQGYDTLPTGLAYGALRIFVVFCFVQTIQLNLFSIIPGPVVQILTAIVPRYSLIPYDDVGIRGVQGWASEPSSAGLTCVAFALVAISQRPELRWRVLAWFAALTVVNKSVYCLVLAILLGIACLFTLRRKFYALLALFPLCALALLYISASDRIAELRANLLIDGINRQSNHELMRFVQILDPLQQFPHVYKPIVLYDVWVAEPMGLLPLMAGYGSVFGLLWLFHLGWRQFSGRQLSMRPLAFVAGFILLVMASPDFIPSIVALAVFIDPKTSLDTMKRPPRSQDTENKTPDWIHPSPVLKENSAL